MVFMPGETVLAGYFIMFFLIEYVSQYGILIYPYRTDEISFAQKSPIPIFVLEI